MKKRISVVVLTIATFLVLLVPLLRSDKRAPPSDDPHERPSRIATPSPRTSTLTPSTRTSLELAEVNAKKLGKAPTLEMPDGQLAYLQPNGEYLAGNVHTAPLESTIPGAISVRPVLD